MARPTPANSNLLFGAIAVAALFLVILLSSSNSCPQPEKKVDATCQATEEKKMRVEVFERLRLKREAYWQTVERLSPMPAGMLETATPLWSCAIRDRIGSVNDGGKWICDPHRLKEGECVVYSFGSAGDTSFESEIYKMKKCDIHIFDPTVSLPESDWYKFHKLGLSDKREVTKIGQLDTLGNIVRSLGHTHIDILKIDIEGAEWASLREWIAGVDVDHFSVDQLNVEIHWPKDANFVKDWIIAVERRGMYQFSYEPNLWHTAAHDTLAELGFVNLTFAMA